KSEHTLKQSESSCDEAKMVWQTAESKLKQLKKSSIKEPKSDQTECREWHQNYDSHQSQFQNQSTLNQDCTHFLDQLKQIDQHLEFLRKSKNILDQDIKQLKQDDYPFNPNCESCQKQPWKLKLNKL